MDKHNIQLYLTAWFITMLGFTSDPRTNSATRRAIQVINIFVVLIVVSTTAFADGTGKIYPYKAPKNADVVRNNDRQGMLLTHPTFQLEDGLNRPCCWNGYGVDPEGANYYYYFNRQPCNYEFMSDLCKVEDEDNKVVAVPEINATKLTALGIVLLYLVKIIDVKTGGKR